VGNKGIDSNDRLKEVEAGLIGGDLGLFCGLIGLF